MSDHFKDIIEDYYEDEEDDDSSQWIDFIQDVKPLKNTDIVVTDITEKKKPRYAFKNEDLFLNRLVVICMCGTMETVNLKKRNLSFTLTFMDAQKNKPNLP